MNTLLPRPLVALLLLLASAAIAAPIQVDVGGQAAPAEPGWVAWISPNRDGGVALSQAFSADFDPDFTVAVDAVDTRQRNAVDLSVPLAVMLRSAFKRSSAITLRVQNLAAGSYEMKMWHHDGNTDSKPTIDIRVTDADGADRLAVDDLKQSWGPGPVFSAGLGPADPATSTFTFRASGTAEVVILVADNDDADELWGASTSWNEAFISGFQLAPAAAPGDPLPVVNRLVGQPYGFTIEITQTPPRLVNTNSVQVRLDGTNVAAQTTTSNQTVWVQHGSTNIFASGSTHPVVVSFDVTGTPATNVTSFLTYVVPTYRALTPAMARPPGTVDLTAPGFSIRAHQTRSDALLAHNIARAEDQVRGRLIDPLTSQPYVNHVTGGATHTDTNVINWDVQLAGAGNFTAANGQPDEAVPGLPGDEASLDNAAFEILTQLELKAGLHTLGVNSDDGFRLTAGLAPQDLFAYLLMGVNGTRTAADTTVQVYAPVDGYYPVRLLYFQAVDGVASLEFFSVDAQGNKILINDRANPAAVKAWRLYTGPAVPYLNGMAPAAGATGVATNATVEAQLVDLASGTASLYVNGTQVTPGSQTSGNVTTLRYTPPTPWMPSMLYTVGLAYGPSSNAWSFRVWRGPKVALVVGNTGALNASDAGVKARCELYGFEVGVYDDGDSQVTDVQDAVLILTSATVSSGTVGAKFTAVPVPILSWEVGLQDDHLMTFGASGTDFGEPGGQTNLVIVNATHPLAAGLALGPQTVVTSAQTFTWGRPDTNTADVIATIAGQPEQACIYAYDTGDLLIDGVTPAPARRVHFFLQENAFAALSESGSRLFDAAAAWVINRPARFNPPRIEGSRFMVSWTGAGVLQSADQVTGPWTNVANPTNALVLDPAGAARFYRIRQ